MAALRWAPALALALACGDEQEDTSAQASLTWYTSCGDPACAGYSGPFDGLETCVDEVEGTACEVEGSACDLETACNNQLVCATEDPTAAPYGCPQSLARFKHRIQYLDDTERESARKQLLATRLATWAYKWDPPERRARLGFLIDDQPDSPAVLADGQHVDLYGYTSLTVAAVQAQEAELASMRTELAETQAALAALRAEVAALREDTTTATPE